MVLTTTLIGLTSQLDTLVSAYKVVLCSRAQGRTFADAKLRQRRCWRRRRIWACFGAFARRWRRNVACAREREGWRSARYVWGYYKCVFLFFHLHSAFSTSLQRPENTPKSAC